MSINYESFPSPHMIDGVKLWIEEGILPGDFLCAVIENNLYEATIRADRINKRNLPEIIEWFIGEAPYKCWGTPERLEEWKGLNKLMEEHHESQD